MVQSLLVLLLIMGCTGAPAPRDPGGVDGADDGAGSDDSASGIPGS